MGLFGFSLTPLSNNRYNPRDPFSSYRPAEVVGTATAKERQQAREAAGRTTTTTPTPEEAEDEEQRLALAYNDRFRGTYNMHMNHNVDILAPFRPTPFFDNADVCKPK